MRKTGGIKTIWFDFENAPHVWVLKPILDYFKKNGYECICSARNFSYTLDLLTNAGVKADVQNYRIYKNILLKIAFTFIRVAKLVYLYRRKKIDLAVSHGSRTQIFAAKILRIPAISMDDYEKSDQIVVQFVHKLLIPKVINKSLWGKYQDKIVHYPGFKEHIYLCDYKPTQSIFKKLGLDKNRTIILLRPESPTSHYYNKKSTLLLWVILKYLSQFSNVTIIFSPRNENQKKEIVNFFEINRINYILPDPKLCGFEIVTTADLVIGGGGTMLRESACLGIPSYSYFSGIWGELDKYLHRVGRLVRIESEKDVKKIKVIKRNRDLDSITSETKGFIIKYLENYLSWQSQ